MTEGRDRVREAPAERLAPPFAAFNLRQAADELRREPAPPVHGHRQKVLARHGHATVALFLFEAGGAMPPHRADGTVSLQCVEGEFAIGAGGAESTIRAGELFVMAPGVEHSVRAMHPSIMLLTVALRTPKADA